MIWIARWGFMFGVAGFTLAAGLSDSLGEVVKFAALAVLSSLLMVAACVWSP